VTGKYSDRKYAVKISPLFRKKGLRKKSKFKYKEAK